jgi:hypothetical protein
MEEEERLMRELRDASESLARELRPRKGQRRNAYIRSVAVETGEMAADVEYWITPNSAADAAEELREYSRKLGGMPDEMRELLETYEQEAGLQGYVAFPKRRAPLLTRRIGGEDSLLKYVPVHGGITYALKDETAMVYGFDTSHFNSAAFPIREKKFIRWQCQLLYEGIMRARKIEREYLRLCDRRARLALARPLRDLAPEAPPNTWQMIDELIDVITGRI